MIQVSTFYKFKILSEPHLHILKDSLQQEGDRLGVRGLFLIGKEGFNATICGEPSCVQEFKDFLCSESVLDEPHLKFKDSRSQNWAFHLFKVKIRDEIVTLDRKDLVPVSDGDHHISSAEWDRLMQEENVQVIDTRNAYETCIGKFKGALDLHINHFQEFPKKIQDLQLPKDKKYLIYCTGGIRCEKALLAMREQGYGNVYQLNGGILQYFSDRGASQFEGECFVFDHRVAVDSNLNPSQKYRLCPHCGQTAETKIDCQQCHSEVYVCQNCLSNSERPEYHTCSKNCAHHFKKGHKTKKIHQESFQKRQSLGFSFLKSTIK